MSTRTDPMDLVFDLATELQLMVNAAHEFYLVAALRDSPTHDAVMADLKKSATMVQRLRDSREALDRYRQWCDEGPGDEAG